MDMRKGGMGSHTRQLHSGCIGFHTPYLAGAAQHVCLSGLNPSFLENDWRIDQEKQELWLSLPKNNINLVICRKMKEKRMSSHQWQVPR